MADQPEIVVLPASSLPDQPWAESLHSIIIEAFQRKDILAFPPSWTRLDPDATVGIDHLATKELGPHGNIAVVLINGSPAGCGGFLPFRGNDWINKENSVDENLGETATSAASSGLHESYPAYLEWEICCFCIHPRHRKRGLSKTLLTAIGTNVRNIGGKRLATNYSKAETGDYWPRMGFKPVSGATSTLKKGFTHTVGMEGLREDLHFQVAMKDL